MDVLEEIKNLTSDKNVKEKKITEDNNEISINYIITKKNGTELI